MDDAVGTETLMSAETSTLADTKQAQVAVAGFLAIAASAVLLAVVMVRDVGPNAANLVTILGCALSGLAAMASRSRLALIASTVALALFALPAAFGGMALAYVPSLVLLVLALRR